MLLLVLGGFVTSFRVGMADPVWPTEPWYLASNFRLEFGYLIEHSHRIVAWIVGIATTILAFAVWWREPERKLRTAGLIALVGLLASFGHFNKEMRSVWENLQRTALETYSVSPGSPNFESTIVESRLLTRVNSWPTIPAFVTGVFALAVIACGVIAGLGGSWLRGLALFVLVAIMVQGLLGGLRVFFNALAGTNLAAIHGAFGQVTFAALAAVALLSAPRRSGDALVESDRSFFSVATWAVVFLLMLQLILAVMLRHYGSGTAQRLHMLTAFAITGTLVWLMTRLSNRPGPKALLGPWCHGLLLILALQVALGVESYLGKFAALGLQAQVPPQLRTVNPMQATIRTAHQFGGSLMLGLAVILAMLASRRPAVYVYQSTLQEKEVPPVAAMALDYAGEEAAPARPPDVAIMALEPPKDDGLVG
jgi:heme A synthase